MDNKILNRVKKMLTLANDVAASEAERDTALRMAYNLLAKYNLTVQDVDAGIFGEKETDLRNEYLSSGWSQVWAKRIYHTIARLFFCEYFYGEKLSSTKCVHFLIGKESNAITARLMSEYLIESILKEARSRYKHNLAPESRSFAAGCADKLVQRVEELKRQQSEEIKTQLKTTSETTSIALMDFYNLEKEANCAIIKNKGYNLEVTNRSTKDVDANAYHAGKKFGESLSLTNQISTN